MPREYRFHAGPIKGKTPAQLSDRMLRWAIDWNAKFIDAHDDPLATVRYQGRYITVARIPEAERNRRVLQAQQALQACLEEAERRTEEEAARAERARQPTASEEPQQLMAMARKRGMELAFASMEVQLAELQHISQEFQRRLLVMADNVEGMRSILANGGAE